MSNPWSGQLAKFLTSKKRTRRFWNVFFSIFTSIIIIALCIFIYQLISENVVYQTEQKFVEYKDGYLITQNCSFEIPDSYEQEVSIDELISSVHEGDSILLLVSAVSDVLIQVTYDSKVVYRRATIDVIPSVICAVVLVLPALTFGIFMLIITNIKKPGKKIDNIQSKYILRFYKS